MTGYRFDLLDPLGMPRAELAESESGLRDALAASAYLAGWEVRTEYPVSNGGRADLVVWSASTIYAVEVKLDLQTTRQFRLGFQQADGYRRHFADAHSHLETKTMLCGRKVDWGTARTVDQQYPEITLTQPYDLALQLACVDTPHDVRLKARTRERFYRTNALRSQRMADFRSDMLRDHHLADLHRNYPAAATFLRESLDLGERIILL